ncbi:MAG: hypothetical protein GY862_39325 [Gammaproteobacteria bacterium]|nr:hypothetical protein [Gammaproteobacteria bacterium]
MNEASEQNTSHLLEQYKLYVEMADRVGSRRIHANQFYLSLLTALLGIAAFAFGADTRAQDFLLIPVALLGILLCMVWYVNLESYRQLNSGKFKVIHELEARLPYACFDEEWKKLKAGKKSGYQRMTKVEKQIPLVMAVPYLILLVYGVLRF